MRTLGAGLFWLAAIAASVGPAASARAQDAARTALVIGNGGYDAAPLANAVNDAADMAAALERVGFEVILASDADQRAMDEAVDAFADALARNRGVGVFYYSGHGVQVEGENYLLPVGSDITHERDVKYGALNAGRVIESMEASGSELNIVILDACRNNPLQSSGRSAARGLSRVSAGGAGLFVSFSTAPGEVALDGDGRNSPYTQHLLAAIAVPGLGLEQVFKQALKGVHNETGGAQVPWISSSFYGEFIFNTAGGAAPERLVAGTSEAREAPSAAGGGATRQQTALFIPGIVPPAATHGLDGVYAVYGTNPNGSPYTGMARIAGGDGDGAFRIDWWIGPQKFSGDGRRDGRWIRVDWGSSSPVIYTQETDGRLDGLWADGSASEILEPVALAGTGDVGAIAGDYEVEGRGGDGANYRGHATIQPAGHGWRMRWTIGQSVYTGSGVLDGGVFTVDWGQTSPVIYAIGDDGRLTGLWASGRGSEVLTPRR
jgi:hypothetical protein